MGHRKKLSNHAPLFDPERYRPEVFRQTAHDYLHAIESADDLETARKTLLSKIGRIERANDRDEQSDMQQTAVKRDCIRAFRGILSARADRRASFSVARRLWEIARGAEPVDLGPGFFAELTHMIEGINGQVRNSFFDPDDRETTDVEADPVKRSEMLDRLWSRVERRLSGYPDGLSVDTSARRSRRRQHIARALGATEDDFYSWKWQIEHLIVDEEQLCKLVCVSSDEIEAVRRSRALRLPFAITPYYASLMDDDPEAGRDRAIRAQVLPTLEYTESIPKTRELRAQFCDFMKEGSTSPAPLVTRRYPAVAIVKPFNSCPQICVYCQRNWEIEEAMADSAMASGSQLRAAIRYIDQHPAIGEVLVTGGDPLALPDAVILDILRRIAAIPHVQVIRIGTRTPVTMPMRITAGLAAELGKLRIPGLREVCVMTHVEHPYEVTPEFVLAVDQLKRQGISVYNQMVFTLFVSRRFEAARLRMLLRRAGVDPYYTFVPKGKEETALYRVPLARVLQEQKEEARLLPGLCRTDEAVYNVPGLGKNYVRAFQHRDLLSILADGSRVYDFHPWEKKIVAQESFVAHDTPILDYLNRLAAIGEDPSDYASIWNYY